MAQKGFRDGLGTPRKRPAAEMLSNMNNSTMSGGQRCAKLPKMSSQSWNSTVEMMDSVSSPGDSGLPSSCGKSPWVPTPGYPNVYSSGVESDTIPECPMLEKVPGQQYQDGQNVTVIETHTVPTLTDCMKHIYMDFIEEISEKEISPYLLQNGIITSSDLEEVHGERTRKRRNDRLIKAIVNGPKKKEFGIVKRIIETFRKVKATAIAESLQEFISESHSDSSMFIEISRQTDNDFRDRLETIRPFLKEELEPLRIVDELLVKGMLSFDDHEDVWTASSRRQRVDVLLENAFANLQRNFTILFDALEKELPGVAMKMRNIQTNSDNNTGESSTSHIYLTFERGTAFPRVVGNPPDFTLKMTFNGRKDEVRKVEENITEKRDGRPVLEAMTVSRLLAGIKNMNISCVKIEMNTLSAKSIDMLKDVFMKDKERFMEEFLRHMLTPDDIDKLKRANTSRIKVELMIPMKQNQVRCNRKMSKEIIVKHFTQLAEEMPDAIEFKAAFGKALEQNSEESRFHEVMKCKKDVRNEEFLRELLKLPEKYLCLFEKELFRLKREDVIKSVTVGGEKRMKEDTAKVIQDNFSFLIEEIEPKDFLHAFDNRGIETDEIIEAIMAAERRSSGARHLLEFLLKKPEAVRPFVQEADRLKLDAIVELFDSDNEEGCDDDASPLRQKILQQYNVIIDEIDPKCLKGVLVQQKILTDKEYEDLCFHESRSKNAVMLMTSLLSKGERGLTHFMSALKQSGYEALVAVIQDAPEEYIPCTCMSRQEKQEATAETSVFTADFSIGYLDVPAPDDSFGQKLQDALSEYECDKPKIDFGTDYALFDEEKSNSASSFRENLEHAIGCTLYDTGERTDFSLDSCPEQHDHGTDSHSAPQDCGIFGNLCWHAKDLWSTRGISPNSLQSDNSPTSSHNSRRRTHCISSNNTTAIRKTFTQAWLEMKFTDI